MILRVVDRAVSSNTQRGGDVQKHGQVHRRGALRGSWKILGGCTQVCMEWCVARCIESVLIGHGDMQEGCAEGCMKDKSTNRGSHRGAWEGWMKGI